MLASYRKSLRAALLIISYLALGLAASAQSAGNSTSVEGVVARPHRSSSSDVRCRNPQSSQRLCAHYRHRRRGQVRHPNVPFNPYHLSVNGQGFAPYSHDIDVRSVVPVTLNISLKVVPSESVTVESGAADLLENDSTFHTDVDKSLFDKLPLESSSSVSSLVTLATQEYQPIPTAFFTAWAITRKIPFRWTASPSPIIRASSSSNQIRSIRSVAGGHHRCTTAEYGTRPASSSTDHPLGPS